MDILRALQEIPLKERNPRNRVTFNEIKDLPKTTLIDKPEQNQRGYAVTQVTPKKGSLANFFHWDIETRSVAKLGKHKLSVGTVAYAAHPSTSVLCVAFARGAYLVEVWVPGEPIPETVLAAAADLDCVWVAHNALFERSVLEHILVPQHGWPAIPVERHACSMALCLSHAYPGGLEKAAVALNINSLKDVDRGKRVKKLWAPRRARKGEPPGVYFVEDAKLFAELLIYCKQDVEVERELHSRLAAIPESEQDAWVLDQRINARGIRIDVPLATAAVTLVEQAVAELNALVTSTTDGAVKKVTEVQEIKKWLVPQGVTIPRRQKKIKGEMVWKDCLEAPDLEKLLVGELPAPARTVLSARLQGAQAAALKFNKMLRTRGADDRSRGLFRFFGATTGRFSGDLFQSQNLKRPDFLKTDEKISEAIEYVSAGDYDAFKARYPDALGVIGDLARSALIPADGHRFIIGDFSSIEARVLAWLADEDPKVEAFRLYDRGEGPDLYVFTAGQVLGLADGTSVRQLGKIFELGLGYAMWADTLLGLVLKSGIPGTEKATMEDAERWVWAWRHANPKIVTYWTWLNVKAKEAMLNPETVIPCQSVSFEMRDKVLYMRLPSGRELSYPAPALKIGKSGKKQIVFENMESGRRKGAWMFGGKWAENVTQAVARDVLMDAMKRLEAAGYTIVLHTHDEAVVEMRDGVGSVEEFKRVFNEVPPWASSLPIASKVFEAARFKKD
jgi:DNA polymerase bacteriophage-type